MTPYEHLVSFLKKNGAYEEWDRSITDSRRQLLKDTACLTNIRSAIDSSFTWDYTTSGFTYWSELHNKFRKYIMSTNQSMTEPKKVTYKRVKAQAKMYESTNNANMEALKSIIPDFLLSHTSSDLVLDNIDNRCEALRQGDFMLNLDADQRAIYKLESNEHTDIGYKKYVEHVKSLLDIGYTSPKCTCAECAEYVGKYNIARNLLNYDTYKSGKVQVKGQTMKLFKYLKSLGMTTERIESITTSRCTDDLYIVITRNPIDYLFCSTNQSFRSCISLDSKYEGAYYMGLPATFVDNNRFMVFLTKGKLRSKEVKGAHFRHFRIQARAWGIFGADLNSVFIDQIYPNSSSCDITSIFEEITGMEHINKYGRSHFTSPAIFNENGDRTHIYIDNIRALAVKHDKYTYHSDNGSTGTSLSDTEYDYTGGFEGVTCIDALTHGRNYCSYCDNLTDEDLTSVDSGAPVCDYCLGSHYTWCEACEEFHHNDYVVEIDTSFYCDMCANRIGLQCVECGDWVHTDGSYHTDNGEVCHACFEDNYFYCPACGDSFELTYESDESGTCQDCYDYKEEEEKECA